MKVGHTVLVALGAMRGVDLFQQVLRTHIFPLQPGPASPSPVTKSLLALGIAAAGAYVTEDNWWETVVTAAAAAGLAGLLHEGQQFLESAGAALVIRNAPRTRLR